jgi:hypothetical protein
MLVSSVCAVVLTLLAPRVLCSSTVTVANNCGTNQNPYCKGNSVLEQLCCPYPNVCYWENRNGDAACCPAGQVCDGSYPYYTPTTYISTTPYTTTTTTTPTTWTTTQTGPITITTTENGCQECVTVTSAAGGVYTTVTSAAGQAYTTVTSAAGQAYSTINGVIVVNPAPRSSVVTLLSDIMAALFACAWAFIG